MHLPLLPAEGGPWTTLARLARSIAAGTHGATIGSHAQDLGARCPTGASRPGRHVPRVLMRPDENPGSGSPPKCPGWPSYCRPPEAGRGTCHGEGRLGHGSRPPPGQLPAGDHGHTMPSSAVPSWQLQKRFPGGPPRPRRCAGQVPLSHGVPAPPIQDPKGTLHRVPTTASSQDRPPRPRLSTPGQHLAWPPPREHPRSWQPPLHNTGPTPHPEGCRTLGALAPSSSGSRSRLLTPHPGPSRPCPHGLVRPHQLPRSFPCPRCVATTACHCSPCTLCSVSFLVTPQSHCPPLSPTWLPSLPTLHEPQIFTCCLLTPHFPTSLAAQAGGALLVAPAGCYRQRGPLGALQPVTRLPEALQGWRAAAKLSEACPSHFSFGVKFHVLNPLKLLGTEPQDPRGSRSCLLYGDAGTGGQEALPGASDNAERRLRGTDAHT